MIENVFWVVKDTRKDMNDYFMFNSLPWKYTWKSQYVDYYDDKVWTATHGKHYLGEGVAEKFKDIDHNSAPVKVKLVLTDDKNPDLYMQRYKDSLFIRTHTEKYWHAVQNTNRFLRIIKKYKWVEAERVPHAYRISNKLFPEVTEEMGIVGVNIVRI